jgi:flagellar protein FliO/FliZ
MRPAISVLDWLQYALSFALVIGLLLGLLYALRKLQGGQAFGRKDQRLQVLESLSLGPRQKIALVRVDGLQVLLGITATQITALGPVDAATAAAAQTPPLTSRGEA